MPARGINPRWEERGSGVEPSPPRSVLTQASTEAASAPSQGSLLRSRPLFLNWLGFPHVIGFGLFVCLFYSMLDC